MARSRSGTRNTRGPRKPARRPGDSGAGGVQTIDPSVRGAVEIPSSITVKELAELVGVNPADIIRELIKSGIFATINQVIDRDTASLVTSDLGYEVAEASDDEVDVEAEADANEAAKDAIFEGDDPKNLVSRAPIVTVMGHVDHGKTSLLDAIRKTTVAAGEKGGITQGIGASEVEIKGRRIVFLDTPGHEAFTAMRARGAKVTDIAVLVVAADDGVMPQTAEAIDHARAARVPIVVALNKIDKPDSNPDRVRTELSEHGVIVEDYGGDTPLVPVSAKTGQGLDDLLETILITSDALVDPKADPKRLAIGTVVEAELDKGRGAVATVLVQTGTLKIGDIVVVGETYGRVRAMENSHGKRLQKAGPASAVVLQGLGDVPAAGDILRAVDDERKARSMVEERKNATTARPEGTGRATLEDLYRQIQAGQTKELRIILKADVQGSLGAVVHSLDQIQTDEVRINVLHQGTGDITDNDINLASASDAVVVGFNTKLDATARRTAEATGVEVRTYDIIYKLTDDMEAALRGMLEPEIVEVVEGRAEVRQIFRVGKTQVVAGSYVTQGRIVRGGARVYRGSKLIATDKVDSLRRFRDDVREVATGYECGIGLLGFHGLEEGDIIESFTTQSVSRAGGS
jgi:translation initiation factor IF-2